MKYEEIVAGLHNKERFRRPTMPVGAFIYMVSGSTFVVSRPPLNELLPEGTKVTYHPHIDYLQKVGDEYHCCTWHPSHNDIAANDWEKV